ncbi:MAG: GNAT family N-acetyltransferase [Clostridiales bacterium]|jgi:GNAT superfamily N-acetyltransferase|nr:GNAT family N-acetyltransferase [Clostridiales bacterium]
MVLSYDISKYDKGKPNADISMITDYDQRYLKIIGKFFYKDLPGWNDKTGEKFNVILARGGQIAAYWYRMRLVGAAVWEREGDDWRLLHICLKWKQQRQGHGRVLLDFVLHKIQETAAQGQLKASLPKNATTNFFKDYGFSETIDS